VIRTDLDETTITPRRENHTTNPKARIEHYDEHTTTEHHWHSNEFIL